MTRCISAIGLADAAAILLVIQRAEADRYQRAAVRWLAKLATETDVDLRHIMQATRALEALQHQRGARVELAEICRNAGLPDAAQAFLALIS